MLASLLSGFAASRMMRTPAEPVAAAEPGEEADAGTDALSELDERYPSRV